MIPAIDATSLFGETGSERDAVDAQLMRAAESIGFVCLHGPASLVPTTPAIREQLLQVFALPEGEQRRLWRQFYAPENPNVYRGWNPRDGANGVSIYDLGPDVLRSQNGLTVSGSLSPVEGAPVVDDEDPLLGHTPVPPPDALPGWIDAIDSYYRSMERLGVMVMRSVARGLGLVETFFDSAFDGGISTLRLLRYEYDGSVVRMPEDTGRDPAMPKRGEHVDSGFVTLLCQHGVGGLSAKSRSGDWVEIPPVDGQLVVNFGGVLERWTEGRIRATPHRVASEGPLRFSIPFFFEPRVDAVITPLPVAWATPFEPFSYGDHLWAAMSKFPNFSGVADLRKPRGLPSS